MSKYFKVINIYKVLNQATPMTSPAFSAGDASLGQPQGSCTRVVAQVCGGQGRRWTEVGILGSNWAHLNLELDWPCPFPRQPGRIDSAYSQPRHRLSPFSLTLPPLTHFFSQDPQAVLSVSQDYANRGKIGSTIIGEPGLP